MKQRTPACPLKSLVWRNRVNGVKIRSEQLSKEHHKCACGHVKSPTHPGKFLSEELSEFSRVVRQPHMEADTAEPSHNNLFLKESSYLKWMNCFITMSF